ncbi:MAG: Thermostable carboxypeptidase 1 [Fimbriimonadaceae bacterium]|nr:Thermostable carboxypeptidase 1 [Fimbriimonadaceae bacterium]
MEVLSQLKARMHDIDALHAACALMDWDQQTYMPRGGAEARGEQTGILARMAHEMLVANETADILGGINGGLDPESDDAALVRVVKRQYDLATKIPSSLVEEKTKLSVIAHEKWVEARQKNDFAGFQSTLERMFEIARQEAEYLGYTDHIYDALLDQYEEGATAADCRAMFDALKPQVDLVHEIQKAPTIDDSKLYGTWDHSKQGAFTEMLVKEIGFDMERGRQDTAPHPFCTNFSVNDVRLTTRYKDYIGSAIFGSLHEAGHGMYEQGSPARWDRSPLAGGVSLGIHESQSRLWENIVGRSKPFWNRFLPKLQATFPDLSGISVDDWYRMINRVQPSFIRVEADELTYNMHIMVRFEVECDILEGTLSVKDLPEVWNDKYERYLGIRPSTDSEGCLQDVHWSVGSIGYFPTYSMGNLLSYQIWNCLRRDLGDTDKLIESGDFESILGWLKLQIYSKGKKYRPKDLVERVTGKPMGAEDYVDGLSAKYRDIYGLS